MSKWYANKSPNDLSSHPNGGHHPHLMLPHHLYVNQMTSASRTKRMVTADIVRAVKRRWMQLFMPGKKN